MLLLFQGRLITVDSSRTILALGVALRCNFDLYPVQGRYRLHIPPFFELVNKKGFLRCCGHILFSLALSSNAKSVPLT